MVRLSSEVWFVASSAGLALFCLGADHAVFKWEDKWFQLRHGVALRAVTDSLVHGLVGGWCWVNVLLLRTSEGLTCMGGILQAVLCVVMATAIDLDHMIEARSLSIKVWLCPLTQNRVNRDLNLLSRMLSACQSVHLLTTQL